MIAEAIKAIADMARNAANLTPVEFESESPRSQKFLHLDGSVSAVDAPIPARNHVVGTLGEIVALADRFAGDEEEDGTIGDTAGRQADPVVWYDGNRVVLIADDRGHRCDRMTLELIESQIFVRVRRLVANPVWMSPRDFIRLLRIELAGAMSPDVLLNRVRRIRIENGQITEAASSHGKESIGRSVKAELATGGDQMPEEVVIQIPVYSTPGERGFTYAMTCAVEINPETPNTPFRLMPLPDEVERVSAEAVGAIGKRLAAGLPSGVNCYFGSP